MEWTDEAVETLTTMWAEGASARDIADRLGGVSRNAVIGKAHRLGLSKPTKKPEPEPVPEPVSADRLTERMCRWPIGHPGDPDFTFCGGPRVPGRPYCREHCRLAYRGKADEAA